MSGDALRAEYSVAGSLLIEPSCLTDVRPLLCLEDFQDERCRSVFQAACRLSDAGEPLDAVTISHAAGVENAFALELMETTPTAANVLVYAGLVRKNGIWAALDELGHHLQESALSRLENPLEAISQAQSRLDALTEESECSLLTSDEVLCEFYRYRERLEAGETSVLRLGFPSVDQILGGLMRGGLYICAARPGIGKTAFGLAAADMAAKSGKVLLISLEMSAVELTARRVAAVSGIGYNRLLYGRLNEREQLEMSKASTVLAERSLEINRQPSATVAEISLMAQRSKPDLLVIDYLGLIRAENSRLSEYERITQISGDLKRLARRLNLPILCLCQLNREAVGQAGHRPALNNLRSSGAIEQDADGVLLLHRPNYYAEEHVGPGEAQPFEIEVAKNRHGRTGRVSLDWYASNNRFIDHREGVHTWTVNSWQ